MLPGNKLKHCLCLSPVWGDHHSNWDLLIGTQEPVSRNLHNYLGLFPARRCVCYTVNPEYFARTKFLYAGDLWPFVRMKCLYSRWSLRILQLALNFTYAFYFRTEAAAYTLNENKMHTKYSGCSVLSLDWPGFLRYLSQRTYSTKDMFTLFIQASVEYYPFTVHSFFLFYCISHITLHKSRDAYALTINNNKRDWCLTWK